MPLPSSGNIRFSQIIQEFGRGSRLSSYYNVDRGVPSSGDLRISHFYGKRNRYYDDVIDDGRDRRRNPDDPERFLE